MIALPRRHTARLLLALALSLLLHAAMLATPTFELPQTESPPLAPLTAKLEPLPQIAAAPVPENKPAPPSSPAEHIAPELPPTASEPSPESAEKDPHARDLPATAEAIAQAARPPRPLPVHAQLTFTAYRGNGGLLLGEAVHRLYADEGQYLLTAETQTTGLAGLFKSYRLIQISQGDTDAQGLRPMSYAEEKQQSGTTQGLEAGFEWKTGTLKFSHGDSAELPAEAQDILSFLYQLSQLPLDRKVVPIAVSNGKKLEHYELEIGEEEEIETPLGTLRALPLRKRHGEGEEGLDVWLGLEYRLLPVRIRQIDRNGEVAGELVISDIRVSDGPVSPD